MFGLGNWRKSEAGIGIMNNFKFSKPAKARQVNKKKHSKKRRKIRNKIAKKSRKVNRKCA